MLLFFLRYWKKKNRRGPVGPMKAHPWRNKREKRDGIMLIILWGNEKKNIMNKGEKRKKG